jgi:heat-inducible transcriptional repressor
LTPQPPDTVLNERAQHLLRALVQRYIRDGEPVASRALARDAGLDLSPASIRNVMADLEQLGLIAAPHTSAGRVPTARGYRVFVDTLLTVKPVERDALRRAEQTLGRDESGPGQLAGAASTLLAELTRLAGVVTTPRREQAAWRQIEFLPLGEDRVLAILVFQDGEVQNKVLQLERRYEPQALARASAFLNERFAGRDLGTIREQLLGEMQQHRASMDQLMRDAIQIAERMFAAAPERAGVMVTGEKHLIDFAELSNIDTLRRLFEAFEQKREILGLLDKCAAAEGVQIFIGEESGYRALDECSVVTAPYKVDGQVVGVLGVIGPTRMAYDRVIPIVDLTARLMSTALSQRR